CSKRFVYEGLRGFKINPWDAIGCGIEKTHPNASQQQIALGIIPPSPPYLKSRKNRYYWHLLLTRPPSPHARRDGEHREGPEENSVQEISVGSKTCRHRKSRLRFVVRLFRLPLIHTFDNHVIYLHLCRHFRHLGNLFVFDTEDFTNTCFVSGVVAVDVTLGMALAPAYRSETGDSDTDGRNFQPAVRKEEHTYAGQHNHRKHVRVDDVQVPLPIFLPNARVARTPKNRRIQRKTSETMDVSERGKCCRLAKNPFASTQPSESWAARTASVVQQNGTCLQAREPEERRRRGRGGRRREL